MINERSEYRKKIEKRLFAYNDLKAKIENDRLDLEDLKKEGCALRSKDIIYRSVKGGIRLSPEEITQIKIDALKKQMDESIREIARIDDALSSVKDDNYSMVIKMRYVDRKSDEIIAEAAHCDVSTVRRNRKRLLSRLAVRLYGAEAMTI